MLQLSEACNMLKYVRALTWHLLPGFTWQIPEQFWNRTLKLVKKVLHYLQGTKGLMMTYRRSDSLHMVGYSDSDYARVNAYPDVDFLSSRKRGAISWKSSKQTVTTSSTMYDGL